MIRSMTGFSEKKFDHDAFSIKFTIRSLNHRYFDWNYRGVQLGELEDRLRGLCQKRISRGRVDVYIEINVMDNSRWDFRINQDLLSLVLSSMDKSLTDLNRDMTISVENLFDIPHVVELKRKDFSASEVAFIEECFEKTLTALLKSREREGREIKRELSNHLSMLKQGMLTISRLARKQPGLIKEKLMERLNELGAGSFSNNEKMLTEAAYLAQRYDINEEMERLGSHLKHMKEILSPGTEGAVGKKLDFIAQELYREANTINSKAQDILIIKECLKLKNEVESIRQQVQNLE